MDHNEALRLQAAEKYLSGELTRVQRDEYEEHYFDCPTCAEEIQATVAFMESAKQVVRESVPQTVENKDFRERQKGWLAWLRPAFAVPVFAALVLVVAYQNGVTIPRLRESSSSASPQIISSSIHLAGSVRGGSESGEAMKKLQVHSGESFLLDFDFTPSRTFGSYRWELQDRAGRPVRQGTVSGGKTNQAVHLAILGGVERADEYNLVFFGGADGNGKTASENEVQRLTFVVEFPH